MGGSVLNSNKQEATANVFALFLAGQYEGERRNSGATHLLFV